MQKKKTIINLEEIQQKRRELVSNLKLQDKTKLMTFTDASEFLSTNKPKRFGPTEIILLLLAITPDKPIKGKTMMMKQAFLTEKQLTFDIEDLEFVGHRFGPHSFLVENILKNMEFLNLIEKKGTNKNPKYFLSERGNERAIKILNTLNATELKQLKEFRIGCDELGTDGMLRFVYNNYPDYINESIIKRRYVLVDWSKKK